MRRGRRWRWKIGQWGWEWGVGGWGGRGSGTGQYSITSVFAEVATMVLALIIGPTILCNSSPEKFVQKLTRRSRLRLPRGETSRAPAVVVCPMPPSRHERTKGTRLGYGHGYRKVVQRSKSEARHDKRGASHFQLSQSRQYMIGRLPLSIRRSCKPPVLFHVPRSKENTHTQTRARGGKHKNAAISQKAQTG